MSEIEARIAEVLAGHMMRHQGQCVCGWRLTYGPHKLLKTEHEAAREHVAAMLVPVIREEFAAAVRDLADLVEPYSGIELANSASRADVANWLRARADNLEES